MRGNDTEMDTLEYVRGTKHWKLADWLEFWSTRPPKPLIVDADALALMPEAEYGDIVTMGNKDNPARDMISGFIIPHTQRFVLTRPPSGPGN